VICPQPPGHFAFLDDLLGGRSQTPVAALSTGTELANGRHDAS
jgi:hypothetical protein